MEALIHPDIGLSFWTIICFILLVLILSKTAWKPLINAINEREEGLKRTRESTDLARLEAEKIKKELDSRLADLKNEIKNQLDEARKAARKEKDSMLEDARRTALAITESAKKEIEVQRAEALRDMRRKISEISLATAGKMLNNTVDQRLNGELAEKCLVEIEKNGPDLKIEADKN